MRADLRRLSWRELRSGCSMRGRVEPQGSMAVSPLAQQPDMLRLETSRGPISVAGLDDNNVNMRAFSHRTSKIVSFPLPQFIFDLRMTIYAIVRAGERFDADATVELLT